MEEKYMVNDTLESIKYEISFFTDSKISSKNLEFSQALEQLRSNLESFHSELSNLAISKGYCTPVSKAKLEEVERN